MPPRSVQVHLGVEVDVAVWHAAKANEILVELELASGVGACGLAKSDHDRNSIRGRYQGDVLWMPGRHHDVFADSSPIDLAGFEMIRPGGQS